MKTKPIRIKEQIKTTVGSKKKDLIFLNKKQKEEKYKNDLGKNNNVHNRQRFIMAVLKKKAKYENKTNTKNYSRNFPEIKQTTY